MKIITEPTVTVVGVTQFFPHPKYKLPTEKEHYNDGRLQGTPCEQITAMAGKGCYDSYGEDGRAISEHISSLINSRHGSVLEHANVSLFIEGISRGCSHEIVRHRAGFAYSQRSTRYVDEGDCAIVLDPFYAEWYRQEEHENTENFAYINNVTLRDFLITCKHAIDNYGQQILDLKEEFPGNVRSKTELRKWARGKARQLLPHAVETRMTMTGNLRAWRHFIEARSGRGAEAEIRRLAYHVYANLYPLAPTVFGDYKSETVDGFPEYTTPNTKV